MGKARSESMEQTSLLIWDFFCFSGLSCKSQKGTEQKTREKATKEAKPTRPRRAGRRSSSVPCPAPHALLRLLSARGLTSAAAWRTRAASRPASGAHGGGAVPAAVGRGLPGPRAAAGRAPALLRAPRAGCRAHAPL